MYNDLTVDGITYNLACAISRQAEVKASDVSGLLMDLNYHNDVIATYMQYTVTLAVPIGEEDSYASLYEVLTDPVASHVFILPYNQETLQVTARVNVVSDEYVREETRGESSVSLWRKIKFVITANEPTKVPA